MSDHERFLQRTFDLAKKAYLAGNRPFGALLVIKNNIIIEAENSVVSANDITAHAEMNLLRKAWQHFDEEILRKSVLYASTEPCLMCAGAIYNTPVNHVVYGCGAQCMHQQFNESLSLTGRAILECREDPICIEGPLFEEEGLKVHINNRWW